MPGKPVHDSNLKRWTTASATSDWLLLAEIALNPMPLLIVKIVPQRTRNSTNPFFMSTFYSDTCLKCSACPG